MLEFEAIKKRVELGFNHPEKIEKGRASRGCRSKDNAGPAIGSRESLGGHRGGKRDFSAHSELN